VTLELAVAGVPQVVAYRTGWLEAQIARRLITAETAVLANLVIGEKVVPEFLQEYGTVEAVSAALSDVIADGRSARARSRPSAGSMPLMDFSGEAPSVKAARDRALRGPSRRAMNDERGAEAPR
jgi:lipid-A-disaccharide synthase